MEPAPEALATGIGIQSKILFPDEQRTAAWIFELHLFRHDAAVGWILAASLRDPIATDAASTLARTTAERLMDAEE